MTTNIILTNPTNICTQTNSLFSFDHWNLHCAVTIPYLFHSSGKKVSLDEMLKTIN